MTFQISHDEARKLLIRMSANAEAEYVTLCRYVEQQRQATCAHVWRGIDSGRLCESCGKEEKL